MATLSWTNAKLTVNWALLSKTIADVTLLKLVKSAKFTGKSKVSSKSRPLLKFSLNDFFLEDGIGLKIRSFDKSDHLQRRNEAEPTYHQLGHTEDMRIGHPNYHVINPSNKDW